MAEFRDRKQLEAWLREQPRAASVVIAARAALRVMPLLRVFAGRKGWRGDILLPLLRGMALPWVVAKYPTHGNELRAAANYAADAARAPVAR